MTTPIRKYSGEKSPRARQINTVTGEAAIAGPVESSGLETAAGTLVGNSDIVDGPVEGLSIVGAFTLADGVLTLLGDAMTSAGLEQFASTTSAELLAVISDAVGSGRLVFSNNPILNSARLNNSALWNVSIHGASGDTRAWVIGVDQFVKLFSGEIGIGTASPRGRLEVRRDQLAETIARITNENIGAAAFATLLLQSGAATVKIRANVDGDYLEMIPSGGITDLRQSFDSYLLRNVAGTQLARLSAEGMRVGGTAAPATSTFTCEGSVALGNLVGEAGTTHTILATTTHLLCSNLTGCTVTLPAAADFPNRVLWIKTIGGAVISASSNVTPLAGGVAGTAICAGVAGTWSMLVSDASTWVIMAG